MPLNMMDEDEREWTAVGFNPIAGTVLWVPADTEIVESSLVEEDIADEDPTP